MRPFISEHQEQGIRDVYPDQALGKTKQQLEDAMKNEAEQGQQNAQMVNPQTVKNAGRIAFWVTVGWGVYECIKWGGAIFTAPATGGGSVVGALATP